MLCCGDSTRPRQSWCCGSLGGSTSGRVRRAHLCAELREHNRVHVGHVVERKRTEDTLCCGDSTRLRQSWCCGSHTPSTSGRCARPASARPMQAARERSAFSATWRRIASFALASVAVSHAKMAMPATSQPGN